MQITVIPKAHNSSYSDGQPYIQHDQKHSDFSHNLINQLIVPEIKGHYCSCYLIWQTHNHCQIKPHNINSMLILDGHITDQNEPHIPYCWPTCDQLSSHGTTLIRTISCPRYVGQTSNIRLINSALVRRAIYGLFFSLRCLHTLFLSTCPIYAYSDRKYSAACDQNNQ